MSPSGGSSGAESLLEAARAAMGEHRWAAAHEGFQAARDLGPLDAADLESLGEAMWWRGQIDECLQVMEQSYRRYLAGEDPATRTAGRLAMEIGYYWLLRGEEAIGSGWLGRAQRLLGDAPDSVEYGYLRTLEIIEATAAGEFDTAIELAREVLAVSRRHADETLGSMALVDEGIATIKLGDVDAGMTILDEAMLPVVAGRVRAVFAGNIYCQLMQVCHELSDVRRARQWTDATARWCAGFDSAVMFVGICRIHRAQLKQLGGDWSDAEAEARQVCEELATLNVTAVAEGYYQLAEVLRLRGDLHGASEAYRSAHERGRDPQPGLSLVHLAEGNTDAAAKGIATAVRLTTDPLALAPLWAAQVEIAVATDDLTAARHASAELSDAAVRFASSGLLADATFARGHVALVDGDLEAALSELSGAVRRYRDLGAPYRAAKAQVLLARTLVATGDASAAALELDAAAACFEALGARIDGNAVARLRPSPMLPAGLSEREVEVLRVVAGGCTNREAAEELFLSEKTVARHLHNIYNKIGVTSRTAAAAFAFRHDLASPPSD